MKNNLVPRVLSLPRGRERTLGTRLVEKGIARHIFASSVVSTPIDNCKLGNQIARLAEIVVK